MNCSLPGSSVHGILQARTPILESDPISKPGRKSVSALFNDLFQYIFFDILFLARYDDLPALQYTHTHTQITR